MDLQRYKTGEENRTVLINYLTQNDVNHQFNSKIINGLTPLFNFHEGECDQLVEDVLEYLPDVKKRCYEIKEKAIQNSKRTR